MFYDVGNAFFIIMFVFHEFLLEGAAAKKILQSASMETARGHETARQEMMI